MNHKFSGFKIIIHAFLILGGFYSKEKCINAATDAADITVRRYALQNGLWTPDPLVLLGPPENTEGDNSVLYSIGGIPVLKSQASFRTPNNTHLTVQVGSQAILRCSIDNVSPSETVSWVRRRDHHLISLASSTYTSDDRFFLNHSPERQEWTLHLRFAQMRDSGIYECQVSTHPPIGIITTISVVQPIAVIKGSPDLYTELGSDVSLLCRLRNFTIPPTHVFWYHENQMINYNVSRNIKVLNRGGESALYLRQVSKSDSGKYRCAPSSSEAASINLHVLPGDRPAAFIGSTAVRLPSSTSFQESLFIGLLFIFIFVSSHLSIFSVYK